MIAYCSVNTEILIKEKHISKSSKMYGLFLTNFLEVPYVNCKVGISENSKYTRTQIQPNVDILFVFYKII